MLTWVVIGILILLSSVQSGTAQLLDCDFEVDTCSWRTFRGQWSRELSHVPREPESDHTTEDAFYMRMQSVVHMGPVTANLRSPFVKSVNGTCLTFRYSMYGYEVNTLTVSKKERGKPWQDLLRLAGNQGTRWLRAVVDTGSGLFSFKITGTYKGGLGRANIGIDDISFSSGENCQQLAAKSKRPVFDCDFEEDFCFWTRSHRYERNPRRVTVYPHNTTMMTFPPHNNGSSFLRFERINRYQPQDAFIGPVVPIGKDGACLSFWYKYYFTTYSIREFSIKKNDIGSSFEDTVSVGDNLLEIINDERSHSMDFDSDVWKFAQVNLPSGDDYFIYFFLRYWGSDDVSPIAIDDIKLVQDGRCKPVPQEGKVNCDFDKDYCQWYSPQSQLKEPEWIRRKGPTPTAFTGPPGDHTTGAGYYIHFKAPMEGSSSVAHYSNIRTPSFHVSSTGACLSFWYYMYGEDIKTVMLIAEQHRGFDPLWQLEGNQGEKWIQQNLSITLQGEIFLMFKAHSGYFPRADIALDDISITFDGVCESDIVSTTTESTTETVATTTQERKWLPSPVLTIKGDTQPALVHSRVEIICGDHLDEASYTWLRKDEHDFKAVEGQDNRTLLFDKIKRWQEGTYMCSVAKEGYLNAESKTFDIEVVLPQLPNPTLTVMGMANPVYQDSTIELICQDPNNDTDLSYMWESFQGTEVKTLSERGHLLVFDEIQLEQTANYSCTVRKDGFHSAGSNYVEIVVVEDPRPTPWLYHNVDENPVKANERITFTCGREDVEGGVFYWKTNSAAFATSPPPNSRVLVIEKSDPSHNGYYSCRIGKDGYFTSKSRTVQLIVAPGKPCRTRYNCWGDAHSGKCVNRRCECAKKAVLRGDTCVERPMAPKIKVSPDFTQFAYGETFYLICAVREPVPDSLIYEFKKSSEVLGREGEPKDYYIHKVTNATSLDTAYYKCAISSDDLQSDYSKSIYIYVKEFVDLNCDFESRDTCSWLQFDEPHTVNFTVREEHSTSEGSSKTRSNVYLQLPQKIDNQISRGVLRTPKLDDTKQDSCLSFRYRMNGPGVYSLAVWKYSSLWQDAPDRYNLWTVIGDQGNQWIKKKLTIEARGSFYLQFEATGDVAIDDVQYQYRGDCSDHYF